MSHSGNSGGSSSRGDRSKGIELYRQFVEGGSLDIHRKLGFDAMSGMLIKADAKAERDLESVFSPAESDIQAYKGLPVTEEDLERIRSGSFKNPTISSTTTSKVTAQDYANNADYEMTVPLTMNIRIKKGVKIANARKLLGSGGMKGYEKEITVWKGTTWSYRNLVRHENSYGDEYYTVDVVVR